VLSPYSDRSFFRESPRFSLPCAPRGVDRPHVDPNEPEVLEHRLYKGRLSSPPLVSPPFASLSSLRHRPNLGMSHPGETLSAEVADRPEILLSSFSLPSFLLGTGSSSIMHSRRNLNGSPIPYFPGCVTEPLTA